MVRAGISALSFHTSLDCAEGGTADTLAELLGLKDNRAAFDEGIPCGRVGQLAEPLDFENFVEKVKSAVLAGRHSAVARHAGKCYRRIAVCPGEAKSLYGAAMEAGRGRIYLRLDAIQRALRRCRA